MVEVLRVKKLESFFLKISYDKDNLDSFFKAEHKENYANNLVDDLDDLPFPDWDYYSKKYRTNNI